MSKDKKKALKVFKQLTDNGHRLRKSEPFEAVFADIVDVYNEYAACIKLTEYSSICSIREYKQLAEFLEDRGLRKESIARIYDVMEQEINKIADDDAKILNTIKKEGELK